MTDAYVSLVITALTVAAALSLVVERMLEVVKHLRDKENAGIDKGQATKSANFSIEKARELTNQLKTVLQAYEQAKDVNALRQSEMKSMVEAAPPTPVKQQNGANEPDDMDFEQHSNVTVVAATVYPVSTAQAMLVLSLFGAGLGIILAEIFNLTLVSLFVNSRVPHWADILLTGIAIGGGSQPIHVLLRFLTTRKIPLAQETKESPEAPAQRAPDSAILPLQPAATIAPIDDSYWQTIAYNGGVNPQTLEQHHLRRQEPNLIVYHHTAMASNVPFQGVVDEFLVNKGWLTGYHCVIMPDGAIKPFCRWDRYGNHAKGINERSLGIAFHGNFHTLANDQYSNHDGRFGFQKPTAAQLDAGARVVALWIHLYPDIQLDFDMDILPHKVAMPGHTVCPGSNFPHEEFKNKIAFYFHKWEASQTAQQQIVLFKQKPFIYATA